MLDTYFGCAWPSSGIRRRARCPHQMPAHFGDALWSCGAGVAVALLLGPSSQICHRPNVGHRWRTFHEPVGVCMERGPVRHPELSLYLGTYTDGPAHDWRAMLDMARAM